MGTRRPTTENFTFRQVGLCTAYVNEEVAELASEFCSQHAYRVFTVTDFGVTVRKVPSGFAGRPSRPGLLRRGLFPGRLVIRESEEPGSVYLLLERRANSHACLHSVMDGKSSFSKVPNSYTVRGQA